MLCRRMTPARRSAASKTASLPLIDPESAAATVFNADTMRTGIVAHSFGARSALLFALEHAVAAFVSLDGGIANRAGKGWLDEAELRPQELRMPLLDSLNLSVAQQTTNSLRTVLGAELVSSIGLANQRALDLAFRLGWQHEFADTGRPITAAFAGAPSASFTVYGATPTRDAAIVGVAP